MSRKVAMCVGQNSYDPSTGVTPLRGCVNDAVLIGEMLRFAGFEEVRQIHNEAATQEGILDRLSTEIAKLREGDYFVFWNSSHGYQVQDRSGDELVDGLDEAICTYDTDPRNPLTDDKFAQILARAHPKAFVFLGSDSCHSASLTRGQLEEMSKNPRTPKMWIPPEDVLFRAGKPLLNLDDYVGGLRTRQVALQPARRFGLLAHKNKEMRHLFLSGCLPEEVSWDAKFPQGFHGAMTYHFAKVVLKSWKNGKTITYKEAHKKACSGIKQDQNPQLEGPSRLQDAPVFGHKPK